MIKDGGLLLFQGSSSSCKHKSGDEAAAGATPVFQVAGLLQRHVFLLTSLLLITVTEVGGKSKRKGKRRGARGSGSSSIGGSNADGGGGGASSRISPQFGPSIAITGNNVFYRLISVVGGSSLGFIGVRLSVVYACCVHSSSCCSAPSHRVFCDAYMMCVCVCVCFHVHP
jgi:hypothetical protein